MNTQTHTLYHTVKSVVLYSSGDVLKSYLYNKLNQNMKCMEENKENTKWAKQKA